MKNNVIRDMFARNIHDCNTFIGALKETTDTMEALMCHFAMHGKKKEARKFLAESKAFSGELVGFLREKYPRPPDKPSKKVRINAE